MDEARAYGLKPHVAGERHLRVPEAVVGETRMPLLAAGTPGKRIFVVLHGTRIPPPCDMLLDVSEKRTIVRKRFVVVNHDLRASRALDLDLAPSRDVRAEVVDVEPLRRLENALGLEKLKLAARHGILGRDDAPGRVFLNLRAAQIAASALVPRIVPFAVAKAVEDDRRVVRAPCSVRDEKRPSVAVQLAADLRAADPRRRREIPGVGRERVLPSVSEKHLQRVRSALQHARHGEVERRDTLVWLAGDRREDVVSGFLAVHVDLAPSRDGDGEHGLLRFCIKRKLLQQHRRGLRGIRRVAGNPLRRGQCRNGHVGGADKRSKDRNHFLSHLFILPPLKVLPRHARRH